MKVSSADFLVGYEAQRRIKAMTEEDLVSVADSNCKRCYGLGRYAYTLRTQKGRGILICRCVLKGMMSKVREEMNLAQSSKR